MNTTYPAAISPLLSLSRTAEPAPAQSTLAPLPADVRAELAGARFVVVGAGQIGRPLVGELARAGASVAWVSRRTPAAIPAGVTHSALDARDGAALGRLAEGARAIIVAVNPGRYDAKVWARDLPPVLEGVIAAAAASRARLVVLENLYMYRLGAPLGPDRDEVPATAKGRVRKALADRLRRAHAEGVATVSLRPSDFWGGGLDEGLLTDATIAGMRRGKRPMIVLDGAAAHAWSHRDDVVHMLVRLAVAPPDVLGRAWIAPSIHVAPRELIAAAGRALGVAVRPRALRRWQLVLAAPFVPGARGLIEMLPQWAAPYLVDDAATRARFGVAPVALDAGVHDLTSRVARARPTE